MSNDPSTEKELENLRVMVEEFQKLYTLFDESADFSSVEPEDLEVRLKSFASEGLAFNKTRLYEEVVLLCEKLGMLNEIPEGLSDIEAVKMFIKSNVRKRKELEKKMK